MQFLVIFVCLSCGRVHRVGTAAQIKDRISEDPVHGLIVILESQMADFRKILGVLAAGLVIVGDIDDLFKGRHIRLARGMVPNGI